MRLSVSSVTASSCEHPSGRRSRDVASLETGIDVPPPIGERKTVTPARGKRAELVLLGVRQGELLVAQNVNVEAIGDACGNPYHRLNVTNNPAPFRYDADQDRR